MKSAISSRLMNAKEYFKKQVKEIRLNDLLIFTIIIALTVAYKSTICDFVESAAEWLNESFDNSRSTKVVVFAAFMFAIYILFKKLKDKKISKTLMLLSTYSMLFYLYFRWCNKCVAWEYIKFGYVTYFDILGVLSIIIIVSYIIGELRALFAKKRVNTGCDTLLSDDAIAHSDEDLLNRLPFVKEFTKEVLNCDTSKSAYSVGVVAPWGSGKTSFIKLFIEEVRENKNVVIICFSPWHYSSKIDIVSAFFKQLSEYTAANDIELFRLICSYSSWLIGEEKSSLLLKFLQKKHQPEELYNKISNILATRNKRIVVIIDDLDRLEGGEILEVLKIIRGSANFPNIVFVAAYDKEYVIKAINSVHTENDERFIEKFFQTEYHLPLHSPEKIEDFVLSKAKEFMSENDFQLFKEKYIEYTWLTSGTRLCDDCIKNIRDAKRWINSIKIGYRLLKGEVRICDLADIAMLKLYFPQIYNLLSVGYKNYLYADNSDFGRYKFWEENVSNNNIYFDIILSKKKDFWECDEVKNLNKRSKEKVKNILSRLLPSTYLPIEEKAFASPFYTPRYFYGILQSSDIPDEEFYGFVKMSHEDFKSALSAEFIEHRSIAFINHWRNYKPVDDNERLKLLRMIFYACEKADNLYCSQDVVRNIVEGFKSKDDIAQILYDVMLENGASYYVCALVTEIKKCFYSWKDYISEELLDTILLDNFKYAIKEDLPKDLILKFFWSTGKEEYYRDAENTYTKYINNPKAVEIFKQGITAKPEKFLFSLIRTETSPMAETKEWEPYFIAEAWPDWDDFEALINSMPQSDKCDEYKEFFAAFKANEYRAVPFKFKYCIKSNE